MAVHRLVRDGTPCRFNRKRCGFIHHFSIFQRAPDSQGSGWSLGAHQFTVEQVCVIEFADMIWSVDVFTALKDEGETVAYFISRRLSDLEATRGRSFAISASVRQKMFPKNFAKVLDGQESHSVAVRLAQNDGVPRPTRICARNSITFKSTYVG